MRGSGLINIPLRSFTNKRSLEQLKTDRFIGNGFRQAPHVERSNMICRIFSSKAFKLGDVGRELGQHSKPTSIMVYRFVYQLVNIEDAESKGTTGVVSVVVPLVVFQSMRVGVTTSIRSCTRHSEGVRGRTRGRMRRRTQRTRIRVGVQTW